MTCYLLTCLLSTLCGISLLRLARCPPERMDQLMMAPVVSLLPCILIPGLGVYLFNLPLYLTAPLACVLVIMLALAAVPGITSTVRPHLVPLATCFLLPVLLHAPAFLGGLENAAFSTKNSDLPLYLLLSHVFWETAPLSVNPSQGPIFYFARYLAPDWRHGASTLLTMLSYFYHPGDAQRPLSLLVVFVIFAAACAAVSFGAVVAAELKMGGWLLVAALLSSSTWLTSIYRASYLDQLVAIPITITLIAQAGTGLEAPLLFGALTSVLGYVYPEFLLILLPCLLATGRLVRQRWQAALGLLLLFPVLPTLKRLLLLRSLHISARVARYGAVNFPGFAQGSTFLSTLWSAREWVGTHPVLTFPLTALLLVGLYKRLHRGDHLSALVFVPCLTAALVAGLINHYGYVSYKLVTLCSPCICLFLVTACLGWSSVVTRGVLSVLLITCLWLDSRPCQLHQPWPQYRALGSVPNLIRSQPIMLAAVNNFDFSLSAYYLRSLPLYVALDCGYPMESIDGPDLDSVKYILTNSGIEHPAGIGQSVFSDTVYTVSELLPSWRLLLLNQYITFDSGSMAQHLFILAHNDGHAHLHGRLNRALWPSETAALQVSCQDAYYRIRTLPVKMLSDPSFEVEVDLGRGLNVLHLGLSASAGMHPALAITSGTMVTP